MKSDKAYLYFKISLVGSIISLGLTFFLTFSLYQMASYLYGNNNNRAVLAQFYTRPPSNSKQQVETIPFRAFDSFDSSRLNWEQIKEMLLRYYVETWFSSLPDKWEMTRRWQPGNLFYMLSHPTIYKKTFLKNKELKEKVESLSGVKTVDILNISQDPNDPNSYTIDFDIYTQLDSGELLPVEKKSVGIHLRHNLNRRSFLGSFSNPYGAYVDKFNLTDRKN